MVQFKDEVWKPTKVNPYYYVSNYGRIKSIERPIWCVANNSYSIRKERILKPNNCNSKGYYRVPIPTNGKSKLYSVHRLVAVAFIPNPKNLPQINHIDGNKSNNRVSNLEWCTNNENMQHAIKTGLQQTDRQKSIMSHKCWMRKLSDEQVLFIRQEWDKIDKSIKGNKQEFCKQIAKQFNLKSISTIMWILKESGKRTNEFLNQDIVQTTNFDKLLNDRKKILENWIYPHGLKYYADIVGVSYAAFQSMNKKIGSIEKTIEYFKTRPKSSEQYAKELGISKHVFYNTCFRKFNKNAIATYEYFKSLQK